MKAPSFFTKEQQADILSAIKEAENMTSGEIRVHIETHIDGDVLDRAAWIFKKIKMDKTAERNGVLFYLAVDNRKFAVIGDHGINSKVPENFWDNIKDIMEKHFREEKFAEGLTKGILMAGLQLKSHFPYHKDDVNELPDDISFDDTVIG
ncbi:MAG: TPM domain-containing protein [Bacteroidia bacterium]|nr:TPM domain-containing protein [Bacteroidia bacterium]